MTDKSHVTMETKVCVVCGIEYSTGNILLDKRLQPRFERTTVTGFGLCDPHTQAHREGWCGLVEVDDSKCRADANGILRPQDAYRTGRVYLVKYETLNKALLDRNVPTSCPYIFVSQEVFNKLLPPEILDEVPDEPERSTAGHVAPGSNRIN